jgi:gas vesicle protein
MRNFVMFTQGFVLGGLVGAVLGLLFAPSSGEQLRARMQGEVERVRNEVQQAATDRRIDLEQQLAALRSPQKGPATPPAI